MTKIASLIPILATSLALIACSTSNDDGPRYNEFSEQDPRIGEEVKRVCRGGGIDGFGETTRNTVVVSTGVKKQHLLKVAGGCFNLQNAQSISFDQHSSCLTRGDSLLAFENVFGPSDTDPRPIKCIITNIYEYDMDAVSDSDPTIEQEAISN
ncbi:DUF6491 family protein [Hirschia litorea]|uniref:DUF6491 family protein n=1 Tax=Hirschia litorea TaxID=1199156 RepID=A0ABW2IGT2_9PROT